MAGLTPDATVDMREVQVADIGSGGGGGNGALFYQGQAYPFTVGGLGVGGIDTSTLDARGEVYKFASVTQFPGSDGEGRYGFAFSNKSAGDVWLQNDAG